MKERICSMKKIILLPLMVLPLLTGCNQQQPRFSLEDWLTDIKEGTPTYFDMSIRNEDGSSHPNNCYSDAGYKLAEFILENTASKSLSGFTPNVNKNHFRYAIRRDMGDYFELQINVYEGGFTMYEEGYNEKKEYLTKLTGYSLPKGVGQAIIDEAVTKWDDMKKLANETYEKVYEQTTPETFYSYIENLSVEPSIIRNKKETKDTNKSLLEDIKEFVYIEKDDWYLFLDDEVVTYGIKNDYVMTIGREQKKPIAQLTRYYTNPALLIDDDYLSWCSVAYSISEEKLNNFIAKVNAI